MKIAFISQPEYFRFTYEHDLDFLGDVREFHFNFSMRNKDFKELEKYNADINIFFRGEFFPENVLKKLTGIKVNLSSEPFPNFVDNKLNYTIDSYNRFLTFKQIINKSFDYIFHYDKSSLPFLEKEGIFLSGEFYFPVATNVYRKMNLETKWDLFFIGRSTVHREFYFRNIKHHYNFLHISHGIWGADCVSYANHSKILLNVHAENEISWEPRVQMLMATGKLLISERITPNPYLLPGVDYIEISNEKDLFEAVTYFLNHDDEREQIAANGLNKVRNLFCSQKIFPEFIKNIMDGKYQKFSYSLPEISYIESKPKKFPSTNEYSREDFKTDREYILFLKESLEEKEQILKSIYNSTTWKIMNKFSYILSLLFPPLSKRRKFVKKIIRFIFKK